MKRLIQLTFLTVLSLFSGIMAQVSTSKWEAQSIVIDGNGTDWNTLPRFFNAESNVKYEFRNDAKNLYLILKAADRSTQMQMLSAGFSIKLKVKTSPPLKVAIAFPALKKGEMPPMIINQDGKIDNLTYKSTEGTVIIPKDTALLDGFLFSKGKILSENNDENSICFARSKTSRELVTYEIRVPLREILGNDFSLLNLNSTPIQLQVNINDLSQRDMKKMRGHQGKGMPGGMPGGSRGGRGMGGEMGGNGMDNRGIGGSDTGDMPGSEMQDAMQGNQGGSNFSMERKSFNIDFKLSTGKE